MLEVEQPDLLQDEAVPVHDDLPVKATELPLQVSDPLTQTLLGVLLRLHPLLSSRHVQHAHLGQQTLGTGDLRV